MDSNQIFEAIKYNLVKAMQSDDVGVRETHITNAQHFFDMLVEDIMNGRAANLNISESFG